MPKWKLCLIAVLIALAGAFSAYLPMLIADLMFLHQARLFNEYSIAQQQRAVQVQAQPTQPTPVAAPPTPAPAVPPPQK